MTPETKIILGNSGSGFLGAGIIKQLSKKVNPKIAGMEFLSFGFARLLGLVRSNAGEDSVDEDFVSP
jgi:hypothetical protein